MFRALKLKVDHVKWPRPFQVTVCLVYAGTCYNQFANKIWSVNYERILVKNRCVWKGSVGPPTTVDWNCDRLPSFEHTRKVQSIASVQNSSSDKVTCGGYTVKPFKLAALKAGDVTTQFWDNILSQINLVYYWYSGSWILWFCLVGEICEITGTQTLRVLQYVVVLATLDIQYLCKKFDHSSCSYSWGLET